MTKAQHEAHLRRVQEINALDAKIERLETINADLLAALEEMLQSVTCHGPAEQVRQLQAEARVTARAAVAKAKGE